MKYKSLLFFLVILLFLFNSIAIPQYIPRLFFKKKISFKNEYIEYKVKKGEWLYKILRSYNIPENQLPLVVKIIKKLNPHIKDLSNLEANQILRIPKIYTKYKTLNYLKKYKYKPKTYRVRKGDNVVKILRNISGVPTKLIFNEYLTIFRLLNPTVDVNNIQTGTKVKVPIPLHPVKNFYPGALKPIKTQKNNKFLTKKRNRSKNKIHSPKKTFTNSIDPKKTLITILQNLGFGVAPGLKAYFPQADGSWLEIDLTKNILLTLTSHKKVLLSLEDYFQEGLKYPFKVIKVSSWNPSEILLQLNKNYPSLVKLWPKNQTFIFNNTNFSTEIKADFVVKIKNKIFTIIFLDKKASTDNMNIVYSFLKNIGVNVLYLKNDDIKQTIEKIKCKLINPKLIYVPTIVEKDILKFIKKKYIPKQKHKNILSYLRKNKIIVKKRIGFYIFRDKDKFIKLYSYLIVIRDKFSSKNKSIYIYRGNNPYISTLLHLNGYKVYILQ
ncbi:LysM domain-containing protein [Desulfonauticus submarinus]|uniref:LysM domain-containing protein n=1 Tax=Desulfonauticus submarinus TaxID=206665 RepID=A0A1H0A8H6_9BACT|nr:LysM peptidoglycan-binding domain-containing protein [Desulfonauticus submarinus]SDN29820.1 LysM domain-containing protein [Desulfonauticus submarinus]